MIKNNLFIIIKKTYFMINMLLLINNIMLYREDYVLF